MNETRTPVAALRACLPPEPAPPPPLATAMTDGVPVFDCAMLADALNDGPREAELRAAFAAILLDGAGCLVLRGAVTDMAALDAASQAFRAIIEAERADAEARHDHFAAGGANDRIWNSLQKLALADPDAFVAVHGSAWIDAVAAAYFGPGYAMTAQVNLVRPGGAAQEAHRDYHLGFMSAGQAAAYPPHVHAMVPRLTLQGAIAHCDMPVASGTTKLLPHSQTWAEGYLHFRDPAVRALFEERCVQLALAKGDVLFFDPALLHAAGENRTADVERLANLLQISSPFGVPMEAIDRLAMVDACYDALAALPEGRARTAAIAAMADGYAFPTSLDTDPPRDGLAPPTMAALLTRALRTGDTKKVAMAALRAAAHRRRP